MHTYASLADAMNFARDNGAATLWNAGSPNEARALGILESVSRRVEQWCGRSSFGSGFGPRLGTNRYDGRGQYELDLRDDLLGTSPTVAVHGSTASVSTTSLTADTDFYLKTVRNHYEPAPFHRLVLHGMGAMAFFPVGYRIVEVTSTWGHQDVRQVLTATASAISSTSTTTVTVSAGAEFSPGQTLLIDSEQLYVRGVSSTTLTVDRGANGTTAATHSAASAIAKYLYDSSVVDATQRLWLKRWRSRDGGADGGDGGGAIGVIVPRESEDTILERALTGVRLDWNGVGS